MWFKRNKQQSAAPESGFEDEDPTEDSALRFLVGTTNDGKQVYGDFKTSVHFISAGNADSGHAAYDENAFVGYMLEHYSPNYLQFVMIDPKQVQLIKYADIPHLCRPLALTPDDAKSVVSELLREMKRRYDMFADAGVLNIEQYNELDEHEPMPYIVLLATEIADLMMTYPNFFKPAFMRLSMQSRAVGIHMYLATQRGDVAGLRSEFIVGCGRLVFGVSSEQTSINLLYETGAESINEPGRLIFTDGHSGNKYHLKAAEVNNDEIRQIITRVKSAGKLGGLHAKD